MSTTKNLRGFLPARKRGSGTNSTGVDELPIASSDARSIFTGDLVKTSLGNIEPVSADADFAVGVFQGVYYETNGEPNFAQYWPANTSASNIKAMVNTNPATTYFIQADATISAGDINTVNFGLTLGAGSTFTGQSGFGIKAATRNTTILPVRAIGVEDVPGNDIAVSAERAFPVVEVRIVKHVDAKLSAPSGI
jgi:hypothetical protein|tara:strand:+ start:241 stop:822 length:582 start_codon:yes stop_codon:yes gene_type:complete